MNLFERIGLARNGKLSLTNALVVAVAARTAIVPTLGWPDLIALLIAILNYINRRTTEAKTSERMYRETKVVTRISALESYIGNIVMQFRSGNQTALETTANGLHSALTQLKEQYEDSARRLVSVERVLTQPASAVSAEENETQVRVKEIHEQMTGLAIAMGIARSK